MIAADRFRPLSTRDSAVRPTFAHRAKVLSLLHGVIIDPKYYGVTVDAAMLETVIGMADGIT